MSLLAILGAALATGIVWRLLRLALRLVALVVLIGALGLCLTQHNTPSRRSSCPPGLHGGRTPRITTQNWRFRDAATRSGQR